VLLALESLRRHQARQQHPPQHRIVLGLDVTQAFIHAPIDEVFYLVVCDELDGLTFMVEIAGKLNQVTLHAGDVLRVLRALYGYRRSPRLWQDWFVEQMAAALMRRLRSEPSVFVTSSDEIWCILHVDDRLVMGPIEAVMELYRKLQESVVIRQVGKLEKSGDELTFLGRTIRLRDDGFEVEGNWTLLLNLAEKLKLSSAKPEATPVVRSSAKEEGDAWSLVDDQISQYRSAVGSLMHIALDQPEVQYAVGVLARGMQAPTSLDVWRLKRALRYLLGRGRMMSVYSVVEDPTELVVYTDADWAGDLRSRRSTSGGIILLGDTWSTSWSRLQAVTALSSAEAEYYSLTLGVQEGRAIQSMLEELNVKVQLRMKCDSLAAKQSAEKVGLLRVKHLALRMHYLKEVVAAGLVIIDKVESSRNLADLWTKPVNASTLRDGLARMPFRCFSGENVEQEVNVIEKEPRADGQPSLPLQVWLQRRYVRQIRAKAQVHWLYHVKQVRAQEVREIEILWRRAQARGDLAAERILAVVFVLFRSSQSYYERALMSAIRWRERICRPLWADCELEVE